MSKTPRQFGLWDSPVTPASLAEGKRLEAARYAPDGTLVWLEGRSGRGVLVDQGPDGEAPRDLTADLDVRAEVGYGGGDFTVHGGHVYFVVHKTGRIFRQPLAGGAAKAITPAFGQAASPVVSPDGRWLAYVHHDEGDDRLALVDAEGRHWPRILAAGRDFYMQPRFSPDGRQVAFIAWDHPNMPWTARNSAWPNCTKLPDRFPNWVNSAYWPAGRTSPSFSRSSPPTAAACCTSATRPVGDVSSLTI